MAALARRDPQVPSNALAALAPLLACPTCGGEIVADTGLSCVACGRRVPLADGIPILLPGEAAGPGGPHEGGELKAAQAAFFDRDVSEEFEIDRPSGAPELYGWLMEEKFRRSVSEIRPALADATALTVCGGSGMDAELLARCGARVVASDISIEAARRTRSRALRHSLLIIPVVADVERLPFRDRAVDVCYVHDGLHHLEDPMVGLSEMARVARLAVALSEPVRARVTDVAVRLGVALEREAAGNRVARLVPAEIDKTLAGQGYEMLRADRYAMYYRHEPGPAVRLLSRRRLTWSARAGLTAFNLVLGRIGNKLAVQAMRRDGTVAPS